MLLKSHRLELFLVPFHSHHHRRNTQKLLLLSRVYCTLFISVLSIRFNWRFDGPSESEWGIDWDHDLRDIIHSMRLYYPV